MKKYFLLPFLSLVLLSITGCGDAKKTSETTNSAKAPETKTPHVVFVTGDEEYRSEESMPMLARLVKREMGAKLTVCYALDSTGIIDPNRPDNIEGSKRLKTPI